MRRSFSRYTSKRRTGVRRTLSKRYSPSSRFTAGRTSRLGPVKRGHVGVREAKVIDSLIVPTGIPSSNATALNCKNFPIQGSALYQRIGSKISMQSLQIRGNVYLPGTTAVASNVLESDIRFVVVYDKQTNGAAPLWSDVFADLPASGTLASSSLSHVNPYNRDRFVILYDTVKHYPGTIITTGASPGYNPTATETALHINVNLRGLETMYKATAGSVADISTGGLFVGYLTNGTASSYLIEYDFRLNYEDY